VELRCILLFALVVLAAGCHPKPKPATDTPAPPVAAAGVTAGQFPDGWPEFIPAYPGSTVVAGVASTFEKQSDKPILSVTMTTPDVPDKVHEFYGQQVGQHQFALASSNETSGEKLSLYERGAQSFSVSTSRDEEKQLTNIELTLVGQYEEHAGDGTPPSEPAAEAKDQKKDDGKGQDKKVASSPLLPVYPGAKADPLKSNGPFVSIHMTTDDPGDQVLSYYEGFYKGQGFAASGRTDLDNQSSETFTGTAGVVSLNLQRSSSKGTAINLSLKSSQ
jgi:hypothetical protein